MIEGVILYKVKNKKRGFTLAEMIISVAILSVVSIYVLQMFVATKNIGTKSYEMDEAVRISKNIIEFISTGQEIGKNSSYDVISSMNYEDGVYTVEFDKNFVVSNSENALYKLTMTSVKKENLNDINIKIERLKPYIMDNKNELEISNISAVKMIAK